MMSTAKMVASAVMEVAWLERFYIKMTFRQVEMQHRRITSETQSIGREQLHAALITKESVEIEAGEAHIYTIYIPESRKAAGDPIFVCTSKTKVKRANSTS
jgi:hypothetical protein